MRVAFIVGQFPALSETFILNQITGLLDLGVEVDIFAFDRQNEPKVHPDVYKYNLLSRTYYYTAPFNKLWRVIKATGLFIINFPKDPTVVLRSLDVSKYGRDALSLRIFYMVLPFLNRRDYDIIHCHFGPNGNLGVVLKDTGVVNGKIITAFHGFDMSKYISENGANVYKTLFSDGDLFMPISNYWEQKLAKIDCDNRKIIVHRMGISLIKFEFSERKSGNTIRILSVGRLVEKKGHEYAIRAVARVLKKHKNIEYLIAGDGPLRNNLEVLVSELGIDGYVRFLGPLEQDEVLELYQQAHIFTLPSVTANGGDQEGTPVVLMEAQATGLPIVSTIHSGIPEVVLDGNSGFLVPERDVDALATKIEYLIEHPEIWPEMGRKGRECVEKNYDIKKLNQQLAEVYQNLIQGKTARSFKVSQKNLKTSG